MKNIVIWFILAILAGFIVGCEKTGYIIFIKTENIEYDNLQQIERMLEDKGFKTVVWEGKKDMPKYPGEFYTLLKKN